jgi:eukaryotic-like serine/threonine-protein kinase
MMASKSFVFRFDDVEVREREFTLIKAGKVLKVEPKTFRALLFLLHNPQRLISKEELLNTVWGDAAVTEGSLTRCISLLRRTLGDDVNDPRYIATVSTVGYRWLCAVERLEDAAVASRLLERGAAETPSKTSAIDIAVTPGAEVLPSAASKPLAWIVAAILAFTLGGFVVAHFHEPAPQHQRIRFKINRPEGQLGLFQLSPDGRFLAFATLEENTKLWVRPLDAVDTRLLTEMPFDLDGFAMFWSWDGDHLVYQSAGKLYKIALDGSPPAVLRDSIPSVNWGVWIDRDVILLSAENGLFRLNPSGGPAVKLDNQVSWCPSPLPGNRYLYVRRDGIFAGSLDGDKPVRILADSSPPTYISASSSGSDGYLLFVRNQTLVAQPFNATKLQLHGEAVVVEQHVGQLTGPGSAFTASTNGILVFGHGDAAEIVLTWVDRAGRKLQRASKPFDLGANPEIRLSPDDSKAIVPIESDHNARTGDIWIADLNRDTLTRFTLNGSGSGIWSPDGRKVLWAANDGKRYLRPADGSGKDEMVYQDPKCGSCVATDWSSDGKLITFAEPGEKNVWEIWLAPTGGDRRPFPYVQGSTYNVWGQFSPDGRWMAYVGEQFPHAQIWVQSVPSGRGRRQISINGGDWPIWRRDGKELFYRQGTHIMAAPIQLTETSVESGAPQALFEVPTNTRFQVSRDGQRFLIPLPADNSDGLTIDTDWRAGLAGRK